MNEDKTKKLAKILERLNNGESTDEVKKEAKDFLATISPLELSIAEQSLINNGLEPGALRNLCSAHMDMMNEELGSIKDDLDINHVIHTFVVEHDALLDYLDELDKINNEVQASNAEMISFDVLTKINDLAKNLIGAEPHHQREEKVLFPALETAGVSGPPRIMKMEHVELRELKKRLLELSEVGAELKVDDFKEELRLIAEPLIFKLRDHIFKENNILYPTALQVIKTESEWLSLKTACDAIGYCAFTPKENI